MTYEDQVLIIRAQLWVDIYMKYTNESWAAKEAALAADHSVALYDKAMDLEGLEEEEEEEDDG